MVVSNGHDFKYVLNLKKRFITPKHVFLSNSQVEHVYRIQT